MPTFEVFLSFSSIFLFHFYIHKTIHPLPSMRKTFLCTPTFLYMTNLFCTRIRTLFLDANTVYIQTLFMLKRLPFFPFFPTHTRSLYKSFFIYTRRSHTQEFLFTHHLHTQNPFIHIFLLHIYINKTFFFSL